jgi:hypothetical protein
MNFSLLDSMGMDLFTLIDTVIKKGTIRKFTQLLLRSESATPSTPLFYRVSNIRSKVWGFSLSKTNRSCQAICTWFF